MSKYHVIVSNPQSSCTIPLYTRCVYKCVHPSALGQIVLSLVELDVAESAPAGSNGNMGHASRVQTQGACCYDELGARIVCYSRALRTEMFLHTIPWKGYPQRPSYKTFTGSGSLCFGRGRGQLMSHRVFIEKTSKHVHRGARCRLS